MLTSHHYLLGSLFAVFCTTSTAPCVYAPSTPSTSTAISSTAISSTAMNLAMFNSGIQSGLPQTPDQSAASVMHFATQQSDAFDVAYRGSGRVEGEPTDQTSEHKQAQVAHRGSGRVLPVTLSISL